MAGPRMQLLRLLFAAWPALAQGAPCNITGFEAFCGYWNRCQRAPLASVQQNGKCLYARLVSISQDSPVGDTPLVEAFRRVLFVQGPDAVAEASERHCTPEGRGRMLLNVGWNSPWTGGSFAYTIFARPCSAATATAPAGTWAVDSAPVPASWAGVQLALRLAYNSSASQDVWDTMAREYSFAGGGLGPPGLDLYGRRFLEVCAFGSDTSPGCCTNRTEVPATYRALAAAFGDPAAASSAHVMTYSSAAVLRAFLSNAMALNPFFNGDGRTFDGCAGYNTVVSSTEFLLPNTHGGAWGQDLVFIGNVTAGAAGFSYVWGTATSCDGSATACDAASGTKVNQTLCIAKYGAYPVPMLPYIYGGPTQSPCRDAPARLLRGTPAAAAIFP